MKPDEASPRPGLQPELASIREQASALDQTGVFPAKALKLFERTGLLAAPIPACLGGLGYGTEPSGAMPLSALLRDLGRTWLPLARVFEGHVNAIRLIVRYGTAEQIARTAADAKSHLFAIWAAEAKPVRLESGVLDGAKSFASGAGAVTRPLVTVARDGAEQLVLLDLPPLDTRVVSRPDLVGMRGAGTAEVDLTGIAVHDDNLIGAPGDYMRQPEISLGAWRALPGLLGGLLAVTDVVATELRRKDRDGDPTQLARFGQMMLACETASLWVDRVAVAAETKSAGEDAATLVKLARHAVDQACSLVLDHARRAVGLASFVRPNSVERICRDIDTYRRQPALDEVLLEAAKQRLQSAQ